MMMHWPALLVPAVLTAHLFMLTVFVIKRADWRGCMDLISLAAICFNSILTGLLMWRGVL